MFAIKKKYYTNKYLKKNSKKTSFNYNNLHIDNCRKYKDFHSYKKFLTYSIYQLFDLDELANNLFRFSLISKIKSTLYIRSSSNNSIFEYGK